MPANKPGVQSMKHYGALSTAATLAQIQSGGRDFQQRPTPFNENRTLLYIQNTGANPGFLRFSEPVKGDGSDILIAAGAAPLVWDQADTCPVEALNFASVLGTTWAILEGTTR